MNFISIDFIVFVGLVHVVHWRLRENRSRKRWLTAASYAFYALWDWRFCGLMLLVTANAWWTGRTLPVLGTAQRRRLLAASIALDLAVLGFFKYFNFFTVNLTSVAGLFGERMDLSLAIILPIGISFYTFHAISYVVDVQRGKVAPVPDFSDVALYISFFPQLIAGPIVRASFFMPQMAVTRRFHFYQQIHGIQLFIRGVLYKAVIADLLARVADPVFNQPSNYDAKALITATVAFYAQIYFDFAGYTLLAIGTARLFGYRLPRNFNFPYAAASLTDFWRRWHMSLSFWIRDYIYIPLGGNHGSSLAQYRNAMIAMILGGLWHGAEWTFVLWGTLHGCGLCIHRLWRGIRPRLGNPGFFRGAVWTAVALMLTQAWIMMAWILFRCGHLSDAALFLDAWAGAPVPGKTMVAPSAGVALLLVALDALIGSVRPAPRPSPGRTGTVLWLGAGALIAVILALMPMEQRPFIYFQF